MRFIDDTSGVNNFRTSIVQVKNTWFMELCYHNERPKQQQVLQ